MRAGSLSTFPGRRYARLAAVLGTVAGVGAAVMVLASSEVADFLGEGPGRLLPYEGTARRVTMGLGTGLATAALAWGSHALRSRPPAGAVGVAVGLGLGLGLTHAIFFPAVALFLAALALDRLDGVPQAAFSRWSPRSRPLLWGAGGVAGVAALVGVAFLSAYLLGPLFDEGKEIHEELGFVASAPGAGPSGGSAAAGAPSASTPQASASPASTPDPVARVISTGELKGEDSFHFGEGTVRIIRTPQGSHIVRFENYSVRNGPDLFVYVSPDPGGDLGARGAANISALKATRGDVTYELPAEIDPAAIRSVVIYCQQFKVKFATARLS